MSIEILIGLYRYHLVGPRVEFLISLYDHNLFCPLKVRGYGVPARGNEERKRPAGITPAPYRTGVCDVCTYGHSCTHTHTRAASTCAHTYVRRMQVLGLRVHFLGWSRKDDELVSDESCFERRGTMVFVCLER
jgi:hypothetical protein